MIKENFLALLLVLLALCAPASGNGDKTVLLAILARNKGHTLPFYLKCIENLDYDKNLITVYINTNDNIDNTEDLLKEWVENNEPKYRKIIFESHEVGGLENSNPHAWTQEKFKVLARIRQSSLQQTKKEQCAYYFVVDCDNFVTPCTLKELIEKDQPIMAPLLRSVPYKEDSYSNFFCAVTEEGYYAHHEDYLDILYKKKIGTFLVPVVHCSYLIKSEYIDDLNYIDESNDYEFVVFSRNARNKGIAQYICNERDFGVLWHLPGEDPKRVTLAEEREAFEQFLKGAPLPWLPAGFKLCTTRFGKYLTRTNDQHVGWVLAQGRHWEEELVQECLNFIRPDSLVVDVGANIGTHAIPWARKAKKIYAFEPQRLIFQQLCANATLNGIQNIHALPVALGHENRAARLDATIPAVAGFSPDRALSYEVTEYPLNFGGVRLGSDGEEVEMRTLDSYHLSGVALLKVDVEGAEPLVFYGARETIKKNRPIIVYERREDRTLTPEMIQTLNLNPEVIHFDIERFIAEEMPHGYHPPRECGSCGERILLPKHQ